MLNIKYIYKLGKQVQYAIPGMTSTAVVVSDAKILAHIFVDDATNAGNVTMCGLTRQEIGKVKESKTLTRGVPMCKGCEESWKSHPSSEWQRWQR